MSIKEDNAIQNSNAYRSFSMIPNRSKFSSSTRLVRYINKEKRFQSEEKLASNFNKKRSAFRERDLIRGFHNYSLMTPQKAKDIHLFSGLNIIQETTKSLAKTQVSDIRISNDKMDRQGHEEKEEKVYSDYLNVPDVKKTMSDQKVKLINTDLPYLKANAKLFNINENPKYGRDIIKLDNLNTSIDDQHEISNPRLNFTYNDFANRITKERTNNLSSKNNEYQIKLDKAAEKASSKQGLSVQPSLVSSGSTEELFYRINKNKNAVTQLYTPKDIHSAATSKLSEYSLNGHKRRSLNIIDKINKNISKLHKYTHFQ